MGPSRPLRPLLLAACLFPLALAAESPRIGIRVLPRGSGADARLAGELVEAARVPTTVFVELAEVPIEGLRPEGLEALEDKARALELELRFRDAAVIWREVVDSLAAGPAVVLAPAGVARAQLALAAAYAEAGESELAVLQFREALAFDDGFTPGPQYAPRLRALFAKARAVGPALPPTPGNEVLDRVAAGAGVDGILWVAVGREGGQRFLVRRLHLGGVDASEEVRTLLPGEDGAAGPVIAREAVSVRGALATRFAQAPPPLPETPWYRSGWFVGGAVGVAVVAGGGLVAARLLGTERVKVVVQH